MYMVRSLYVKPRLWYMQELARSKGDVRRTGSSFGGTEWVGFYWTGEIHNLTRMLLNVSRDSISER